MIFPIDHAFSNMIRLQKYDIKENTYFERFMSGNLVSEPDNKDNKKYIFYCIELQRLEIIIFINFISTRISQTCFTLRYHANQIFSQLCRHF